MQPDPVRIALAIWQPNSFAHSDREWGRNAELHEHADAGPDGKRLADAVCDVDSQFCCDAQSERDSQLEPIGELLALLEQHGLSERERNAEWKPECKWHAVREL